MLVSDAFQKRGIGSALVQRLVEFARDEKLELLTASFLAENQPIEKLFKSQGFMLSATERTQRFGRPIAAVSREDRLGEIAQLGFMWSGIDPADSDKGVDTFQFLGER